MPSSRAPASPPPPAAAEPRRAPPPGPSAWAGRRPGPGSWSGRAPQAHRRCRRRRRRYCHQKPPPRLPRRRPSCRSAKRSRTCSPPRATGTPPSRLPLLRRSDPPRQLPRPPLRPIPTPSRLPPRRAARRVPSVPGGRLDRGGPGPVRALPFPKETRSLPQMRGTDPWGGRMEG